MIEQPSRKHQTETRRNLLRLPILPSTRTSINFSECNPGSRYETEVWLEGKVKQAQGCVSRLVIIWELVQGWLDLKVVKM